MKDWSGKLICTLLGCLVSVLVLGANTVTKTEVSDMIAVESPFVKDRNLILYRLEQIELKLDKLLEQE